MKHTIGVLMFFGYLLLLAGCENEWRRFQEDCKAKGGIAFYADKPICVRKEEIK